MTIARKLKKLYDVREAIRAQLELDEFTLMEDYVEAATGFPMTEYIPNPDASPLMNKLGKILHIKNEIKTAIGIGDDVPFEEYYLHIDISDPRINDPRIILDLQNHIYLSEGDVINLDTVLKVERNSEATMWAGENLIIMPPNTPRINDDGLMIEEEMENLIRNNTFYEGAYQGNSTSHAMYDERIGAYTKLVSTSSYTGMQHTSLKYDDTVGTNRRLTSHVILNKPTSAPVMVHRETSAIYDEMGYGYTLQTGEISNVRGSQYGVNVDVRERSSDMTEISLSGDLVFKNFRHNLAFGQSFSGSRVVSSAGSELHIAYPMAIITDRNYSSIIITNGTPKTRAADTARVTIPDGYEIAGDWDEDVDYVVTGNIAYFTGHGQIRRIVLSPVGYDHAPSIYEDLILEATKVNTLVNHRMGDKIGV